MSCKNFYALFQAHVFNVQRAHCSPNQTFIDFGRLGQFWFVQMQLFQLSSNGFHNRNERHAFYTYSTTTYSVRELFVCVPIVRVAGIVFTTTVSRKNDEYKMPERAPDIKVKTYAYLYMFDIIKLFLLFIYFIVKDPP